MATATKFTDMNILLNAMNQHSRSHDSGPAKVVEDSDPYKRTLGFRCEMCGDSYYINLTDFKSFTPREHGKYLATGDGRQKIAEHLSDEHFDIGKMFANLLAPK